MNNYFTFQRYEHLGTYDPFITYAQELFHVLPQDSWAKSILVIKITMNAQMIQKDVKCGCYFTNS